MSEEVETTEARVTILEVLEATYVLERLGQGTPPSISDIQVQVGSKGKTGRLTNRVILYMLDRDLMEVGEKQTCKLSPLARDAAEFFWNSAPGYIDQSYSAHLDRVLEDASVSEDLVGLFARDGLVNEDGLGTPLGDTVSLILSQLTISPYA